MAESMPGYRFFQISNRRDELLESLGFLLKVNVPQVSAADALGTGIRTKLRAVIRATTVARRNSFL
jgi:hypothetical protein